MVRLVDNKVLYVAVGVAVLFIFAASFKFFDGEEDLSAKNNIAVDMIFGGNPEVAVDPKEGMKLLLEAADGGYALSQKTLGVIYLQGGPVPQDFAEGLKWLRLAAAQDEPNALFNLGLMYGRGEGVPQDDNEAYKYILSAAKLGHEAAIDQMGFFDPKKVAQTMIGKDQEDIDFSSKAEITNLMIQIGSYAYASSDNASIAEGVASVCAHAADNIQALDKTGNFNLYQAVKQWKICFLNAERLLF